MLFVVVVLFVIGCVSYVVDFVCVECEWCVI